MSVASWLTYFHNARSLSSKPSMTNFRNVAQAVLSRGAMLLINSQMPNIVNYIGL